MQLAQFKELVDLIQVEFSPTTGSMAFCTGRPTRALSICCSCIRNKGMLASECIVWHESSVKYEGKLDSYKLKNLLNRWGVCRAHITNVMRLERGDRGECICLGCRQTCRNNKCKLSPWFGRDKRRKQKGDIDNGKTVGSAEAGSGATSD